MAKLLFICETLILGYNFYSGKKRRPEEPPFFIIEFYIIFTTNELFHDKFLFKGALRAFQ
jgi:hypothetical protein